MFEQHPPPPNLPPGKSIHSRFKYIIRLSFDLMIMSVLPNLKSWLSTLNGDILEVGCGMQPYRYLVPNTCIYQGLDWEKANEVFDYKTPNTIYYNGDKFPFPNNKFLYLFHTEVIEHIFDTNSFLHECHRVLKPKGVLFFSVPFQARYHYIPNDFWRFTPASLERILTANGFKNIIITNRGTDITVSQYKFISVIYRWLRGTIFEKTVGIFFVPIAILSLIVGHCTLRWNIGSPDDCLGYCVTAEKD